MECSKQSVTKLKYIPVFRIRAVRVQQLAGFMEWFIQGMEPRLKRIPILAPTSTHPVPVYPQHKHAAGASACTHTHTNVRPRNTTDKKKDSRNRVQKHSHMPRPACSYLHTYTPATHTPPPSPFSRHCHDHTYTQDVCLEVNTERDKDPHPIRDTTKHTKTRKTQEQLAFPRLFSQSISSLLFFFSSPF